MLITYAIKKQKYAIRLDPKAYEFLVNQSALAYLFFSIGNPLKAAVAYEDFLGLCSRSHWSTSIIEGGQLVIIQSIFNLTRCYLALGQSDKAQDTLQELWDPTSTKSISFGHSLFSELAWLYYEVKDACSKVSQVTKHVIWYISLTGCFSFRGVASD
jgi:tetratricopeptide (TPR) repeat protein